MGKFSDDLWGKVYSGSKDALPWIMLIFGMIALGLSWFVIASKSSGWHGLLNTAGSALVAGGFFTVFMRAPMMVGLFQQALHRVVWGDEFICKRTDLEILWRKISSELSGGKFPNISKQLQEMVLNYYLPRTRNYYYENVWRKMIVQSYDPVSNMIEVEQHVKLTLKPHEGARYIDYHIMKKPSQEGSAREDEFTINGDGLEKWDEYKQEKTADGCILSGNERLYHLPLGKQYVIERKSVSRIPMHTEPYSVFRFKNYVQKCEVYARSLCPQIGIRFLHIGTPEEFQDTGGRVLDGYIEKISSTLLFPTQGYMLIYVLAQGVSAQTGSPE